MCLFDEFLDLVAIYDRIPYWQIMAPTLADVLITVSQWVLRTTLMHTTLYCKDLFSCVKSSFQWQTGLQDKHHAPWQIFVTGKIDPSVLAVFHDLIQYQPWRIIVTTLTDGQITLLTLTDDLLWRYLHWFPERSCCVPCGCSGSGSESFSGTTSVDSIVTSTGV